MAASGSVKVIFGSLAANVGIAIAKGVAAALTGSGAMLAEAIHSTADCSNQIFLLIGARESAKIPSEVHPLGSGRVAYFWSFIVALMIFFGGGVLAIREGVHKLADPAPIESAWIAYIVLGVAVVLEGFALFQVTRALFKKKGDARLLRHLADSKDADLVVLFAEDTAAVAGLALALGSLILAEQTGDHRWDAYGSIAIGSLLCIVAVWLARKVKSLLAGEAAAPRVAACFREEAARDERVSEVLRLITLQQGPGQVVVAAKVRMRQGLATADTVQAINSLEARVRERLPEVSWQFVEPDIEA